MKPRQLRARATRPLRRRRFPRGEPPHPLAPVPAALELWRSDAFAPIAAPDAAGSVPRIHRQFADDVLEAARLGDADEAARLLTSWIDAHPPRNGDAWHPYALSTRVGNWIAAATLVPELATEVVARSAWRQLLRLERNLEHDVLGNHLIRNARALVLGGVAFGAPELTREGIDLLRGELEEQILPDGGHYERSPSYHLVVLRDLLEIQAVSPHAWLGETIERMREFAAALQRPDGAPALFNDGTVDVPRLELAAPQPGVAAFEDSGFVVIRDGPLWLVFRCGRSGPAAVPRHAHADALSLQVWWQGRPLLVDPGTSTLESGPVRDEERSTRAHSTVTVDGRDQFGAGARLRYAREGAVEASAVLHRGIRHIRRVEWSAAGEVLILDTLEGRGTHDVGSRLCWAPIATAFELAAIGGGDVTTVPAHTAERLGERVEATATVARMRTRLPLELGWRLALRV